MKKLGDCTISLDDDILQFIQQLGKELDLDQIILHGSRAVNENCERSDIDLAITTIDNEKFLNFVNSLENAPTLLMFDVVNMMNMSFSKALATEIEKKGVIIYEKI